jgi:lipopolysaccharide transport system permease protein
MYATPTVYMQPGPGAGDWVRVLLALNPMSALIAGFRAAALGGDIDWPAVGVAAAVGVGVFVVGCLYFRRVEDAFADIV